MPPQKWKSSVKEVNDGVDKVRQHLDTLIKMDNMKKEIYSNPNTKVEVLVKTKRPSDDWSSILSDTNSQVQPSHKRKVKGRTKNLVTSNSKVTTKLKKKTGPVTSEDEVDMSTKAKGHKFSQRTLQIFLREMRLALKHDNAGQLHKILDDLEYVAANLNEAETASTSLNKTENVIDVAFYKTEAKKAKDDVSLLKRTVWKLEKQIDQMNVQDEAKEAKIKELKVIINRLTSNSNDMLATLTAKADQDDKIKAMEKALNKTQQDLSGERFKSAQLELKNKAADLEIRKLRQIIESLKMAGKENLGNFSQFFKKDPMALETGPDDDETTTIDLALSTDVEKSHEDDPDADPDSAFGSQALPASSAAAVENPIQEMSFKPLDLSETKSSSLGIGGNQSNWSQVLTHANADDAQEPQEVVDKQQAMQNVGAKVAEYLNKLRNDDRFQISLGSELDKGQDQKLDESKLTTGFSTDFEVSTVTEDKFRQGLEASIDLSETNTE